MITNYSKPQAKVNKIFDKLIQSDNTNQDWQKQISKVTHTPVAEMSLFDKLNHIGGRKTAN